MSDPNKDKSAYEEDPESVLDGDGPGEPGDQDTLSTADLRNSFRIIPD